MKRLTAERAREVLDYDRATGIFRWRVNRRSCVAGAVTGSVDAKGYLTIRIDYRLYLAHRLAWLIVTGRWPKHQIDHRNTNKGDNRFDNLREATRHQNRGNVGLSSRNTSGAKGVSWDKNRKRWEASIYLYDRKKHLGRFDSKEAAAAAYAVAAVEHFGEFARVA